MARPSNTPIDGLPSDSDRLSRLNGVHRTTNLFVKSSPFASSSPDRSSHAAMVGSSLQFPLKARTGLGVPFVIDAIAALREKGVYPETLLD